MPDTFKAPEGSADRGTADFRGSYGFGRPAHMSDPGGTYAFEPDPNRALQPRGEFAVVEEAETPGKA